MFSTRALYFITSFGDQAIILPFAAAVAIMLAAAGARRTTAVWCLALGVSWAGAFVAKLIFLSCGHLLPDLDVRSPSGHTAAAVAAYGGFAALWARRSEGRWTRALFIAGALVACGAIALSRVLLHMHSLAEVTLGTLIGLAAPVILYRSKSTATEPHSRPTLFLLLLPLCLIFLLHGATMPIEGLIGRMSRALTALFGICP